MKTIMLTGSTGFVGRNLLPLLNKSYSVYTPTRKELDLYDANAIRKYIKNNQFDVVLHFANPTGHNPLDLQQGLFETSLRVFMSIMQCADLCGKIVYLGSGAEYGKHRDISSISEDSFGEVLPEDSYGLSRYIMSKIAVKHDNVINLRLFACCGPGDPPHKLIPHIINCIKTENSINLNQNVWFDFLYVLDIFPVLVHFIENPAKYKNYNLCSGERILISEIANQVRKQMGSIKEILFNKEGLNLEYTGSNARLKSEIPNWKPHSINESIKEILKIEEK